VRYTGSNVTVSLRDQRGGDTGLTMDDIGTFTIWCERFEVFFTSINVPQGLVFATPIVSYVTVQISIYPKCYEKMCLKDDMHRGIPLHVCASPTATTILC